MTETANKNNKKGCSVKIWIGIGISILIALLLFVAFLLWLFITTRSDFGHTSSLQPVHIVIAGHNFTIPRAYISMRSSWRGGRMSGVLLDVILSNFEPYNKENASEFKKPGHNQKIHFSILSRNYRLPTQVIFARMRKDALGKEKKGPFGFRYYRLPRRYPYEDLFFRYLSDGSLYYLTCSPVGSVPFPGCVASIYIKNDIHLRYSYGRQHLKDWKKIDQGIRKLVRSFESTSTVSK